MLSNGPIKWTQRPDMIIAVDWDVKHQFKQTNIQTNKSIVQSQKQARSLKLWIKEDGLNYSCSENKGADQCLCFRLCRLLVFLCGGSYT